LRSYEARLPCPASDARQSVPPHSRPSFVSYPPPSPLPTPPARADYERQEADVRYKLQELSKGVEFYTKRLGLSFEKIDADALRLIFTLLDPRDPGRRFSFTLRATETDAYTVDECDPPVAALPELLAQLNGEGNDLARFIQLMRREFKRLA
jgi:hypothetical protein